jgi:hypothetical protein
MLTTRPLKPLGYGLGDRGTGGRFQTGAEISLLQSRQSGSRTHARWNRTISLGLGMRGTIPPPLLYFQCVVLNSEQQQIGLHHQKEKNYINSDVTVRNITALFEVFARLSF